MKTRQIVPAIAGIGLLAGLVWWFGPATLWQQFSLLRWYIPILLVLALGKHTLRVWAWKEALQAEGIRFRLPQLLVVRFASQALGYFSSMGSVISDPIKPWLLRKKASVEKMIPPTMAEAVIYWFTALCITTLGTLIAITIAADPYHAFGLVWICLMIFGGGALFLLAQTPLVPKLSAILFRRRALRPRWNSLLRKAGDMETQMRSFRLRYPKAAGRVLGLDLLSQAVMLAEVWAVLHALGVDTDIFRIVAIEAARRAVKMVSFYVPGRLGADEAGAAGAFLLLGMDPTAGLTLAMVRRVEGLLWAAVGLTWLSLGEVVRIPFTSPQETGFKPLLVPQQSIRREREGVL